MTSQFQLIDIGSCSLDLDAGVCDFESAIALPNAEIDLAIFLFDDSGMSSKQMNVLQQVSFNFPIKKFKLLLLLLFSSFFLSFFLLLREIVF